MNLEISPSFPDVIIYNLWVNNRANFHLIKDEIHLA